MWNSKFNLKRIVIFSMCLVLLPSLLVSSLMMTKVNGELSNDVATMPDNYYDNHLHQQIVFLDYFVNKFRQDSNSNYRSRELHIKSSRSGIYLDQQGVEETAAKRDDSPDADDHNEVDFHDFRKKPPCKGGKKKKKKLWRSMSRKKKASIILGSIGFAFVKLRLVALPPLGVSEDTAITTSMTTPTTMGITTTTTSTATTTSTTDTTTSPTTIAVTTTTPATTTAVTTTTPTTTTVPTTLPTTTTDTTTATSVMSTTTATTIMPNFFARLLRVPCAIQVTDTTGEYTTIRSPGTQVEQCLSITVAVGRKIQITCTSINVSIGTYVTILDRTGTSIVANPPIINTPYTTADNTLTIKSLASSANIDELSCSWITV